MKGSCRVGEALGTCLNTRVENLGFYRHEEAILDLGWSPSFDFFSSNINRPSRLQFKSLKHLSMETEY
jgi:hypothetical protein